MRCALSPESPCRLFGYYGKVANPLAKEDRANFGAALENFSTENFFVICNSGASSYAEVEEIEFESEENEDAAMNGDIPIAAAFEVHLEAGKAPKYLHIGARKISRANLKRDSPTIRSEMQLRIL